MVIALEPNRSFADLCAPTARPLQSTGKINLFDWDLPREVVNAYKRKGVVQLYKWQEGAIQEGIHGDNLVFSAPTSGGKSLVAEVLLCRRLMPYETPTRRKPLTRPRCLFVVPYVSIVIEKANHLDEVLGPAGVSVRGYFGNDQTLVLRPQGEEVAVCTMEKANVAVNLLMEEDRLKEVACIVVDEVHMLGDKSRGAGLELMLTKVLYANTNCQIIAMSATMRGMETLRHWLNARLFVTNYRPVPLQEHVAVNGAIYRIKASEQLQVSKETYRNDFDKAVEKIRVLPSSYARDKDHIVPLVGEAVGRRESVLIFCSSRRQCENCAELIADTLSEVCSIYASQVCQGGFKTQVSPEQTAGRELLVQKLQDVLAGYPNPALEKLLRAGIGYHHAGMTKEERYCVECGFCEGQLSVLTATTTLAAGINLPAQRVIIRSLKQGISNLERGVYLQMAGRAGRAGYSLYGESYIIGRDDFSDWRLIGKLITAPLPRLISSLLPIDNALTGEGKLEFSVEASLSMQRMLLEGISCGCVRRAQDVKRLIGSTFVSHQVSYKYLSKLTVEALRSLRRMKAITWKPDTERSCDVLDKKRGSWVPLVRGQALYACGLDIRDAERLMDGLEDARDRMVLDDITHAIYAVMLYHPLDGGLDWIWWQQMLKNLAPSRKRVANVVGVTQSLVELYMVKPISKEVEAKHTRFAAACAIADLIDYGDVHRVAEKWDVPHSTSSSTTTAGQWQSLLADVAKWAAMAALVCRAADWWKLEEVMNRLAEQATVGCPPELMDLMRIKDCMTTPKAKELFKNGIQTVVALASAPAEKVEKAVANALVRKGRKRKDRAEDKITVGQASEPGLRALVKRASRALVHGACQLLLKDAQDADAAATGLLDCARLKGNSPLKREAKSRRVSF